MRARTPRVPLRSGLQHTGGDAGHHFPWSPQRAADPDASSKRPPLLPPAALRSVYRQLLRACDFGRRPEVFAFNHLAASLHGHCLASAPVNGAGGAQWATEQSAPLGFTRSLGAVATPRAVVRAVAAAMRDPSAIIATGAAGEGNHHRNSNSPSFPTAAAGRIFSELRCATRRASAGGAAPSSAELRNLPCLEHPSALLPGESVRFRLREPQHVRLARIALGLDDGDAAADGRFVHLCEDPDDVGAAAAAEAGRPSNAVAGALVTVVEHVWQRDGTLVADCVVGPRVAVLREADDYDGCAADELPLRYADVVVVRDAASDELEPTAHLAALVRDRIAAVAAESPNIFAARTAPPLFDAEALSFYGLDVAFPRRVGDSDSSAGVADAPLEAARHRWLASRDTLGRLRAAYSALH